MDVSVLHSFFFRPSFVPLDFIGNAFNKTVITNLLKFHNGHSRGSIVRKGMNDTQSTKEILITFVK